MSEEKAKYQVKPTGRGGPGRGQGRHKGKGNDGKPAKKQISLRLEAWLVDWIKSRPSQVKTVEEALIRQIERENQE